MKGFSIKKEPLRKSGKPPAKKLPREKPKDPEEERIANLFPLFFPLEGPLIHRLLPDPDPLRIAATHVAKKKLDEKKSREESLRRWGELAGRLLKNQNVPLAPPPESSEIDSLKSRFPHMEKALEILQDYLDLSRLSGGSLRFPPILLVGPPGAGKTAFSLDLAKAMGVPYRLVNAASLTHTFILGGLDISWSSGKEGMILSLLLEGRGNPTLILDEIDKNEKGLSGTSTSPSLENFLLNVLEPVTARKYTDEFLGSAYPVDASQVQWVFTANDLRGVSAPLLSRLTVIPVREPTGEELREAILPSLYRDILKENHLTGKVPEHLPEDVIQTLSGSPREARKRILRLLAGFARVGRFEAPEEELVVKTKVIGFHAEGGKG